MKQLLLALIPISLWAGVAQAIPQSVVVAQCSFASYSSKQYSRECTSQASYCIDSAGIVSASRDGCRNTLDIQCNGKSVFSGTWSPGSMDDSKTLVIQGDAASSSSSQAPRIMIKQGESHEENFSILEFAGESLDGNCNLTFDWKRIGTHL